MRIAVVSDIHANLTALEAVIGDMRRTGVDLVVHGGDLMSGGPRPAEVIDRVREMKWPGVYGNTDEMLWMPHRVREGGCSLHEALAPHAQKRLHLVAGRSVG